MSSEVKKSLVDAEFSGQRIDAWLAIQQGCTRSQAQRMIKNGHVRIGSEVTTKAGVTVSEGDEVTWELHGDSDGGDISVPLAILYEDDALIIVNKQPGVSVHPGSGIRTGTIVDGIRAHLVDASWDYRAGLVHRLDKDTSGALVVAKRPEILAALQAQWQERSVKKTYVALAHGNLTPSKGSIEAPIKRHAIQRRQMSVANNGRPAVTHYEVLREYDRYSYLKLTPVTGRTHQIRVHLAAIGHPVAGDTTYGKSHIEEDLQSYGLKRQFLHAADISFQHPVSGERVTFEAPLAPDLQKVLDVLE